MEAVLWGLSLRVCVLTPWQPVSFQRHQASPQSDTFPGDITRFYETALTSPQRPASNSGCHLCFWPANRCRLQVPIVPSSGMINLLGGLTELRETCHSPDCQFIIKRCDSGTAGWEGRVGQYVGGAWSFHSLSPPLSSLHAVTSLGTPGPAVQRICGGFVEMVGFTKSLVLLMDSPAPSLSPEEIPTVQELCTKTRDKDQICISYYKSQ